jgi:hypothetical protein
MNTSDAVAAALSNQQASAHSTTSNTSLAPKGGHRMAVNRHGIDA